MYTNSADVIKNNSESYASILKIFSILHDEENGFNGLANNIQQQLSKEELNLLKTREQLLYVHNLVLEKINEWENKKRKYNRSEFENDVLKEIKVMLSDVKKYSETHSLDNFDSLKFALSGENIMKYHFYCSCGNAASAFAYVNSILPEKEQIPSDKLMFLTSTHWQHLSDGMTGHTIPCIKMNDGNLYACDPQIKPTKSGIEFIVSEIKEENAIHHILKGCGPEPYIITRIISPQEYAEKYNVFEAFIKECGIVLPNKAKNFLKEIMKEINSDDMKIYIDKLVQQGYLTENDKKNLLLYLGKTRINNKQNQKTQVSKQIQNTRD